MIEIVGLAHRGVVLRRTVRVLKLVEDRMGGERLGNLVQGVLQDNGLVLLDVGGGVLGIVGLIR